MRDLFPRRDLEYASNPFDLAAGHRPTNPRASWTPAAAGKGKGREREEDKEEEDDDVQCSRCGGPGDLRRGRLGVGASRSSVSMRAPRWQQRGEFACRVAVSGSVQG
uniref:Uncharacterized protein n=1 Tax=Oryza rufipogon TaxID=4529 RepID=A0A0E0PI50_ORYRU